MRKIPLIIENLGSWGAERQICGLAVLLTKMNNSPERDSVISHQMRNLIQD